MFVALGCFGLLPHTHVMPLAIAAGLSALVAVFAGACHQWRTAGTHPALSWTQALAIAFGGYFLLTIGHDRFFSRHSSESATHTFGPVLLLAAYLLLAMLPTIPRLRHVRGSPILLDAILLAILAALLSTVFKAWRHQTFDGFQPRFLADPGYWRLLLHAVLNPVPWAVILFLTLPAALAFRLARHNPSTYRLTALSMALLLPPVYLLLRPF
jgi:hypothetical protein